MVMRALCASFLLFALAAASAAELKVKVIDPQSAAVAGAQVTLFVTEGNASSTRIATTSSEGIVTFVGLSSTSVYQVQVLAPGFAPDREIDPSHAELITVQLQLATASETVVVTATRTPLPAEET